MREAIATLIFMNAGHFGLAAGVKAWAPRIPLWALMVSAYLLDIIFIILYIFGIESFRPIDPAHPGYGSVIINALYTHSLVGALLISAFARSITWLGSALPSSRWYFWMPVGSIIRSLI